MPVTVKKIVLWRTEVESRECLPAPWARLTRLVPATRCRRKSGY